MQVEKIKEAFFKFMVRKVDFTEMQFAREMNETYEKACQSVTMNQAVGFYAGYQAALASLEEKATDSGDAEIEKAFQFLEAMGVPRERAKTVSNGIDVLATRYRKEINAINGSHATKCAECKQYRPMGIEKVDPCCLTCMLQCPTNCPLDKEGD